MNIISSLDFIRAIIYPGHTIAQLPGVQGPLVAPRVGQRKPGNKKSKQLFGSGFDAKKKMGRGGRTARIQPNKGCQMPRTSPYVLVFASGTKTGGGSGFETLARASRTTPPVLEAWVCGVVTSHFDGGVWRKARALGIPSAYWAGPYLARGYQNFVRYFNADYVMLSGWLKLAAGLEPARTINIHPGPLPRFGGPKLYGHHVHEAVMAAYHRGEVTHSAVTMHFVDAAYDRGPVFFSLPVPIEPHDTPETLAARVNRAEHAWQPRVLNYIVQQQVRLVGHEVVYASAELRRSLMPES
jgi:phosphoribosylglycinamide formyltransferase 1